MKGFAKAIKVKYLISLEIFIRKGKYLDKKKRNQFIREYRKKISTFSENMQALRDLFFFFLKKYVKNYKKFII